MSVVTKSRVVPSSSRMLGALRYSCGHSFAKIPPHARLQRELRPVLRSSGSDAVTSDEDAFFPEPCAPAFVMVDQGHPHFTQISIDVSMWSASVISNRICISGQETATHAWVVVIRLL
jgi:hypothetical protein